MNRPAFTAKNATHLNSRDTKHSANLSLQHGSTNAPDLGNLISSQFRLCAALGIDEVSNRFEVIRIAAGPIAAKMVKFQSLRNLPVLLLIKVDMGPDVSTIYPYALVPRTSIAPLTNPTPGYRINNVLNRRRSATMTNNKSGRLTANDAATRMILLADQRLFAATAMAVTVWNGIFWVRHSSASLQAVRIRHGPGR